MNIKAGTVTLNLLQPQVMGVLNVTPDSFSDGGCYLDQDAAIRHAESMAADGAAIVDIGGESTRPGARSIPVQEELDRVLPVVEAIVKRVDVAVSIDTSAPVVMTEAGKAGVGLINDVFALRREGALTAAAATDCAICLVHMQGEPRAMQENPVYNDVVREVGEFLRARATLCVDNGIMIERIIVDPGFGFGKTDLHNIELLAKLDRLEELGLPILVGLSRKRTLGNLTGRDVANRIPAGIAAAVLAFERGATIFRTHDVAATVDAFRIAAAVREAQTNRNEENI
jgi:dihydropteroate synthase